MKLLTNFSANLDGYRFVRTAAQHTTERLTLPMLRDKKGGSVGYQTVVLSNYICGVMKVSANQSPFFKTSLSPFFVIANAKRQLTMDKDEIRKKLFDEISKTELLIKEYLEMTKPVAPDVAIGRISRMDAINNKSVTEAALRQAEEKLVNLHRVLSKIDDKDFGICLKCHKQIPLGRILIRPESLYCVNCAK